MRAFACRSLPPAKDCPVYSCANGRSGTSETQASEGLLIPPGAQVPHPGVGSGAGNSPGRLSQGCQGSPPPQGQALGSTLFRKESEQTPHLLVPQSCLSAQIHADSPSLPQPVTAWSLQDTARGLSNFGGLHLGVRGRLCSQDLLVRALPFSEGPRQPSWPSPCSSFPPSPTPQGHFELSDTHEKVMQTNVRATCNLSQSYSNP